MNKNVMSDLESYFYSNPKFNSRIPTYNDASDYTTNAPSYYDDLARKNKLMKVLALRIWEYEEEMIRRLEQWDKNLEDFPDDVKDLLEKWLEDGTLDHIINDTIFNWKADKTYVDAELNKKVDKGELYVNVMDYGNPVTLSTLSNARDFAIEKHRTLFFHGGYEYNFNSDVNLGDIRGVIIDGEINFEAPGQRLIIEKNSQLADPFNMKAGRVNIGGVELRGVKNSEIHIGYTPTLDLFADGDNRDIDSIAYNSFYPGRIDTINIKDINSGWINENKFFGGRINKVTIGGFYTHNHNIFYSPTLERTGSPAEINIERGASNLFKEVRWEGTENKIIFGEQTYNNYVERSWTGAPNGYYVGSYRIDNIDDKGVNNLVNSFLDSKYNDDTLYSISEESYNFNTDWVNVQENGFKTTFAGVYSSFIDTGIFKLTDDFSLSLLSNTPLWRMFVHLYDHAGNRITLNSIQEDSLFSFQMGVNYAGGFSNPSPREEIHLNVKTHSDVGYIRIFVHPDTEGNFSFLNLTVRKKNRSSQVIPLLKENDMLRGSKKPTYILPEGLKIYNTLPSKGEPIGWVSDGVEWLTFGEIREMTEFNSGNFITAAELNKTFYTIPHGLSAIPKKYSIYPGNSITGNSGIKYINVTPGNLVVFLNNAITENEEVSLRWWAER